MFKPLISGIAKTEIWLVTFAVALSLLKPDFLPQALFIALSFWVIRWLAFGKPTQRTPADIGIILLGLMLPVTLWATALPTNTHVQVYRLLLSILYYYCMVNWSVQTQKLSWIITGILLTGLGLAISAFFTVQWSTSKLQFIPAPIYSYFVRIVNDTVHPNVMAGSLLLFLPIGLALLLFAWTELGTWKKILLIFISILITVVLVLTQSRGALLGLLSVLIMMVVLRWRWGWITIPLIILFAVFLIYQFGLETILDFITSGVTLEGTQGRIEIWSRAIFMIQDFPFTGIGMGSFRNVADLLYPFFLALPGKIEHAHNLFLQIAVDLGIPGLIAWLSILLVIIITAWQLYRFGKNQENQWAAALGVGFLGSQLALIIHGLTDAVTWGMVRPVPFVWGIWGAAVAAWAIILKTNKKNPSPAKS